MKHTWSYIRTAALSLLLCLVMLGGSLPTVSAGGSVAASLDYGIPGNEGNTVVDTLNFYEMLFGEGTKPTPAESVYLTLDGIRFTYNKNLPDDLISTDYTSATGSLVVTIRPYSYTASNGAKVTWIPFRAVIDGEACEMTEEDGVYVCRLEVHRSQDFDMQVDYRWDVTIPAETIEYIRTAAYESGMDAIALRDAYREELDAWKKQTEDFAEWQEYLAWKVIEDAYLQKLAAYNAAKEAYETYLKDYAAYEEAVKQYELWLKYFEYEAWRQENWDAYNAYLTYQKQYKAVQEKLKLMDSLFINDSNGWQMYSAVMGGAVDQVLAKEDFLASFGYTQVSVAGDATDALRAVLPKYQQLRNASYPSDYERTKTLYNFYVQNYDVLKKNFCDLYSSLNDLFKVREIANEIAKRGKMPHYLQFVGQLYVVSTCLDEKGGRDPNWTINGEYRPLKLSEVVEPCQLLPDGDWHPANTPMPKEVASVEAMPEVQRPAGQQPTRQPVPPAVVKEPGKMPVAPDDPWKGNYPSETAQPGEEPKRPAFDQLTSNLIKEIEGGILLPYTETPEAKTLSFETSIERKVSVLNYKTVSIYDYHNNLIERRQVKFGASCFLPNLDRPADAQYSYSFKGWTLIDGTGVNLAVITSDLALYPSYDRTLQRYSVTWVFGNETSTSLWTYGSTPIPPAKWSMATEVRDHYRYTFSGWDSEVLPVTGDVTYRGEMVATLLDYEVTWVLYDGITVTERYPALSEPVFTGDTSRPTDDYRYEFRGWIGPAGVLTKDTTYTADYKRIKLASGNGGNALKIDYDEESVTVNAESSLAIDLSELLKLTESLENELTVRWTGGTQLKMTAEQQAAFRAAGGNGIILQEVKEGNIRSYRFGFTDANGNRMEMLGSGVTVELPFTYTDTDQTVFFIKTADGYEQLTETTLLLTEETVIYEMTSYLVTATPNEHCNTMTLPPMAIEGDVISLALKCVFGYEITGAVVRDAAGNEIPVSKDMTFVMPASPVSITLQVEQIRYTVTFVVDGKVWATQEYNLGDEIKLPKDPTKASTDDYVFTFIGWGEVPVLATGNERNLTFTASFSRVKQNVDYSTGESESLIFDVLLPIAIAVFVVLAGGITGLVVFLKMRKKRKAQIRAKAMTEAIAETPVSVPDPSNTTEEENGAQK